MNHRLHIQNVRRVMTACTAMLMAGTGLFASQIVTIYDNLDADKLPVFTIPAGVVKIGLLPVSFKAFVHASGGINLYSDSLTSKGKRIITNELLHRLVMEKMEAKVLVPAGSEDSARFKEIDHLFDAVENAMLAHVFTSNERFQTRIDTFDYTIGPIDSLCDHYGVDAICMVKGVDEEQTARRETMIRNARIANAFLGTAVPRDDICTFNAVIIGRNGRILWYNFVREIGDNALDDASAMGSVFSKLFMHINKR